MPQNPPSDSTPARDPNTETRMFGRFTLKRVLGRGGMGIVWLAYDEELQREVAMKFLPEMLTRDAEAVQDLKRETRRSLDLTHHHIVRIYDLAQDGQSAAIVMEYVDGDSLSARKTRQTGGCFSVGEIAKWVGHFCQAMDYAHRQARVVHRDLKPANLMINSRDDLKVTDFGISRSLTDSMTRVSQTNTAGTLAYMSPEQALGASPSPADDVYAFGATLYDLLTGRPPFFRGNLQVQLENVMPPPMAQRREELDHRGDPIPEIWEEVIRSCLAKRPEQRPTNLLDVGHTLGVLALSTGPIRLTTRPAAELTSPAPAAPAPPTAPSTAKRQLAPTSLDDILAPEAKPSTPPPPPVATPAPSPAPAPPPAPAAAASRRITWLWPAIAAALAVGALAIWAFVKPAGNTVAQATPTPVAPTPAPATPDPQIAAADKLAKAADDAIGARDFAAARRDLATLEAFTPPDARTPRLRQQLEDAEMRQRDADFAALLTTAEQALAARNAPAARDAISKAAALRTDPRLDPLRQALAQLEAPPPATPAPEPPPPAATPKSTPVVRTEEPRRPPERTTEPRKRPTTPAPTREPPKIVRTTPAPAPAAPTPKPRTTRPFSIPGT